MTETASRLPRLTAADAVHYLLTRHGIPVAKSTLKQWAWRGGGPAFQKSGARRLYPIEELDAWAGQRLTRAVASTSELTSLLTIGREPAQEPVQKTTQVAAKSSAAKQHNYQSRVRPAPPPGACKTPINLPLLK
jgi:hypothetical protein